VQSAIAEEGVYMNKLSVIIPFVNEFPQLIFTVQSIAQELIGEIDFEIIAVDNYCEEFANQKKKQNLDSSPDKGGDTIQACSRHNPWLKYLKYDKRLSHWQAKRAGVEISTGDVLWFCDSHCIVSKNGLVGMFRYYVDNYHTVDGSIHLPLTYKILESRRLIYKVVTSNFSRGEIDYSFTPLRIIDHVFEVPCMSCCGIMLSREIYDMTGGWSPELGIYGGGEQFMNFTLSVLGKKKWIYPFGTLFHHGEKRSYHYLYDDYIRNKILAAYLYGGKEWATLFSLHTKGRPEVLKSFKDDVISKCSSQRALIKSNQKLTIQQWADRWINPN